MKMLVLGAGAIGGYIGGRLAQAGTDVTFLVRPHRRDQLRRDGLRIESPLGDLSIPVKALGSSEVTPDFDVLLLACKAYDLDSALESMAPAMTGHCVVVPMLNGMAHLSALDERFGAAQVMGGTCSISVTLGDDGVIRHGDPMQRVSFGERDRTTSRRAHALADVFRATSLDWELAEDIEQNMWEKIAVLSVLAAANCLFRANVAEIIAAPGGLDVLRDAVDVSFEVASRNGHPPRPGALRFAHAMLLDPASTRSGSMLHDLESGLRVEGDHVIGWMLGEARRHGLDARLLSLAYTHVKAYENRRAAGRLPS